MTNQNNSFKILSSKYMALLDNTCVLAIGAFILFCNYLVFMVVPNERVMGPVQRIFYFHVGSAIACYCAFAVLMISGLCYLATRDIRADVVAHAASEVSLLFCSIVMITGMIWGHSAWNTWFRWEPRLVTFLLLWLIALSLNLLRAFGDQKKVPAHSAILGIVGAITVPIVVYSIRLLPQAAQLHPLVVENRGLREPSFEYTLFACMAAIVLLQFLLIWFRTRLGLLELNKN